MRKLTVALVAMAITIFTARATFAGKGSVHDSAGALTPADIADIVSTAEKSPFDVHVLTSRSAPSQAAFEADVGRAVTAPNVLAVGLELNRHVTTVMYGGATGIPSGNGKRLGDGAIAFFRAGNFGQGISTIIINAAQMRAVAPVAVSVPASTPSGTETVIVSTTAQVAPPIETSEGHPWLWSLFFLTLIGGSAWWWVKRRDRQASQYEESLADNVLDRESRRFDPEPISPAKVYASRPSTYVASYGPSYTNRRAAPSVTAPSSVNTTTVINGSGGSSDLVTGLVLGQAMANNNAASHDRYVERERPAPAPSYSAPSTSNWDPPARTSEPDPAPSSSSWDSGSSSSSSYSSDSGSSSSWDSGSSSSSDFGSSSDSSSW